MAIQRLGSCLRNGAETRADLESTLVQLGEATKSLQIKISNLADSTATTKVDLKAHTQIAQSLEHE